MVRASPSQQDQIKAEIQPYLNILSFKINKYETKYVKEKGEKYSILPLSELDWNYYIVEHSQVQAKSKIEIIFSLSSLDLTILFEALYHGVQNGNTGGAFGISKSQLRTLNYLHDTSFIVPEKKKLTEKEIHEIAAINNLIVSFNFKEFSFIDKALSDFVKIKDISKQSPFKILSCFAILELLLTTYKSRTSNENSLTHQLQKKIALLNNLFNNKIEINNYFKGSDTNTLETIIEKLYQYRNDIAHGNSSNFEKDLRILKDQQNKILPFLMELLRQVLIISLEKPQFVNDLKEC